MKKTLYVLALLACGVFIYNISLKFPTEQVAASTPAPKTAVVLPDIDEKDDAIFCSYLATGGIENGTDIPSGVTLSDYYISSGPCIPAQGSVTSQFGYRIHPITGQSSFHTGIDIASEQDSNIFAAWSGTVEAVGVSEFYGNYLKIRHTSSLVTFYGHCDKITVSKGERVNRGDTVAKMGSTGMSTGPHLHFEIRIDCVRVDPGKVLTGL